MKIAFILLCIIKLEKINKNFILGYNSTALKDSEGQVIVSGTGVGFERDEEREKRDTPVYYDGSEKLKKSLSKK